MNDEIRCPKMSLNLYIKFRKFSIKKIKIV